MTEPAAPAPAFDFSAFDFDVRVQDDLYRHVNGRWLREAEIPPDKPLTGAFMKLRDAAEEAVRDIITTLDGGTPDSDEAKIADLYASFMDEEAIEAAGVTPLAGLFAEIDAVSDPEDLARLLGSFARRGVAGLVGVDTESDPGDPNRYVMFAGQGGLGLPDEAYYRLDEHAEIRSEYRTHIARSFTLAAVGQPDDQADQVMLLETDIAVTHWDKVKTRDIRLMYNLQNLADFTAAAPGLHWREFMAGADIDESAMSELVAVQSSFFCEVAALLTRERMQACRAWTR